MFSLICAWIKAWVNNRQAGDLKRHLAHYDVIVMSWYPIKNVASVMRYFEKTTHTIFSFGLWLKPCNCWHWTYWTDVSSWCFITMKSRWQHGPKTPSTRLFLQQFLPVKNKENNKAIRYCMTLCKGNASMTDVFSYKGPILWKSLPPLHRNTYMFVRWNSLHQYIQISFNWKTIVYTC